MSSLQTVTRASAAAAGPAVSAATGVVRVVDKVPSAAGVVTLVLERPDGGRVPDWAPGAHVDLILPSGEIRQYSLCGDRWDAHRYQVSVLREVDGRGGSAYIHDELEPGSVIGLGGPRNNFALVPSARYLFIGGGIGITPLVPMLDQGVRVGADWRLLYGGRSRSSMAYAEELSATYPEHVTLVPQDECGVLDLGFLHEPDPATSVYACGPAPMLDAVRAAASAWPASRVRMERFTAKPQGAPVLAGPFTVALARSGVELVVGPGESVLDAVRTAGLPALTSCGQGVCGTCETTVLDGVPDHRDSIYDETERAACDRMFICVSRSCTERLVLDL